MLNTQPSNQLMSFAIHKRKIVIFKQTIGDCQNIGGLSFSFSVPINYATYLASYIIKTDMGKNYKRFLSTSI